MKNSSIISQMVHKIIFLKNITKSEIDPPKWQQVIETFAQVKPVCDNRFAFLEGIQFGNIITEEYFLFKIRFIKELDNTMRISFHNQIFEIKRIIDEDSKGRLLSIVALKI
jgi:SPP1 family predicted phage head-tail adaptor